MATDTEPIVRESSRATTPRHEAPSRAPAAGAAQVFWADWLALQAWFVACVLMWSLQILEFLAGWRN